jgi:phosphosulfolactate synthase (CoM biosynthesis protein A)
MRESIYQCPRCGSRIDEHHGMEAVEGDDHGYCHACESIAHEPEKVGERMHMYTKTALACRPHETLEQLAASCEGLAEHVRQLDEEGFEVVEAQGDGHIYLERIDEYEATAVD